MPITAQYSPDIFTLVPMSALSIQHFESHPIWSEYYDYDEREEIVAVSGVAPACTLARTKANASNDSENEPVIAE